MKIDQIMIKEILNSEAVGQYSAAVKLSEAWYFIPVIITASLFPSILNAKAKSEELYYSRFQKLYDLMFWLAFIIALPMTFLSTWVVEFLYGTQYFQTATVLMLHIWTGLFVFLGLPMSKWFVSENLQIYSLYRSIVGVVSNIGLNLLLIPKYGINGAAIATLISSFIASYLFNLVNKKTYLSFKLQTKAIIFPLRLLIQGYRK